jgi:fucose permease
MTFPNAPTMRRNRFSVSLTFFICGFIYANWSTRLPRIQDTFALSNSHLGLVLLCVAVGSLCAMPLTGWLISKKGSKLTAVISLVSFSLILIVIPFLDVTWQLVVAFYWLGFFMGSLDVSMNAQAVLVEQRYQKPILSSFHAFFSVGVMIGALSSSFFAKYLDTLQAHFVIVSLLCVGLSLVVIPLLIDDSDAAQSSEGSHFLLPNKSMVWLGIIAFCAMLAEGSIADWSTNYLENSLKTHAYIAPIGLSIFSGTMTIGRFLGDKARAYFGDNKLLVMSSLMATVGLFFALAFNSYWLFFVGISAVGLGLATVVPIVFSQAGNNKNLPPGIGLAMVTTLGYLGFLVGPPIIGFLADWQDLRFGLFFVVFLLAVLSVLSKFK